MKGIISAVYDAAKHELGWIKRMPAWLLAALVVSLSGGTIEGHIYPVLADIHITNASMEHDAKLGRRLCFDATLIKQRWARGVMYVAQVYEDEQMNPAIMGVAHRDGTPFGLARANTPPGRLNVDFCVNAAHMSDGLKRAGIRLFIDWSVPWRPWTIEQPPIWVDYYAPK